MDKTQCLLGEVGRMLKIKPYRISYAISVGLLPETEVRIANKRVFSWHEIEQVAKYFGVELKLPKEVRR